MRTILISVSSVIKPAAVWLTLFVFAIPQAWAALNHNPNSVKALSKAYGFILGQEYSLARVERTYPEATMQVQMARLTFNAAFPDIKNKLEAELATALTEPKFKEYRAEMNSKIRPMLNKQYLTPQLAEQFLAQVKARAKGEEIEPDVLRYLLAVRYANNPVAEFGDGFRQRFRTDGKGKSQGLNFHLQLPYSWLMKEGERPHVVQKWANEGGTGLSSIILMVQDTGGETPSKAEVDHSVKAGDLRDMVPDGATYIDGGALYQEKSAGFWVEMSMPQERAGVKLFTQGFMYILFFRGKAISIMCMAGGSPKDTTRVAEKTSKLKPLCQQVMNSVVLNQAY